METIVDDQTFVVGLSELFREQMKAYELATLLPLAETACGALSLSPAVVPVEGYYSESSELEKFFRLIRALQSAEGQELSSGPGEHAIVRLREVFTSPAMGRLEENDGLIPRTSSPFGEALRSLANWSIDDLSRKAQNLVRNDDAGLVAVASATGDPTAICVARESVALTADVELAEIDSSNFIWAVSKHVAEVAHRFVSSLADATGITLPKPEEPSSQLYGEAAKAAELVGRCILIGERSSTAHPFYHWYIDTCRDELAVKDFWSSSVWTTDNLRRMPANRRPLSGALVGPPHRGKEPESQEGTLLDSRPKDIEERHNRKSWFARLIQRNR